METWESIKKVQPLIGQILTNSIDRNRVTHAYLFNGGRGTGKEETAIQLAKSLFCVQRNGVEPCHVCRECKRIASKNHPDVHWVIPEGQSIKKEQIDELQREFSYAGMESARKVYIVKNAETLTQKSANQILKFLEEPAKETTAIILTENSQAVLPTIQSRCQILDFKPLSPALFTQKLIETGLSETDARLLSVLTNNLDEAIDWHGNDWFAVARNLVVQLVEMLNRDPDDVYLFLHQQYFKHFKDKDQIRFGLDLLLIAFKDVLMFHLEGVPVLLGDKHRQLMMAFQREKLITILNDIITARKRLKQNVHQSLVMEKLILQMKR